MGDPGRRHQGPLYLRPSSRLFGSICSLGRGRAVLQLPNRKCVFNTSGHGREGAKGGVVTRQRSPSLTELEENRNHTTQRVWVIELKNVEGYAFYLKFSELL